MKTVYICHVGAFLSFWLGGGSFRAFLPVFSFSPSAFEVLLEAILGQRCTVPLPHVAVKFPGVSPFQLFVDSRHMHAERVGYILRACSFQITGFQSFTVCQRQISVVSHVFTSLWFGFMHGHFVKSAFSGVYFSTGFHALRLASFFLGRLDRIGFHIKSRKLVSLHGTF